MPELYYIQSRGYCGNCLLWWKVDGHGYTTNLDEAWKVTREEADKHTKSRGDEDIAWPVALIDLWTERHLNSQTFVRMQSQMLKAL